MKVTSVASPHQVQDLSTPDHVRTARAVAAFNKGTSSHDIGQQTGQTPEHHSVDPNNISVEELSAIQAPGLDKGTEIEATQETPPQTETAPAKVEPPKEQLPKDPALQKQFAQLARQEKLLRQKAQQQAQELQTQKAALDAKAQELAAIEARYKGYIAPDRLKADALTTLEEAGVTYDEVTQQAINRQPTDPRVLSHIAKLEARIGELQEKADKAAISYQEQQQAQYQAAVKQIRLDAQALVKSNPEEFEAIAKTGSIKDVVELIERTYRKDGVVLTVEEAAQEVENYLVDEVQKLTSIGKIKKRIEQSAQATRSTQQTQSKPQTQTGPMKTLTNAASSTRKLSAKERAIARANGFKGDFGI